MPSRKKPRPEYYRSLETHRESLSRLAERHGIDRIKRLYDRAQDELESKLRRLVDKSTFTAQQHRILLAQAKQGQQVIAKKMAGETGDLSREAQVESLRGLGSQVTRLEKKFKDADIVLPIDEAARFAGVIDKRRSSLLRQHETSMANYSDHVVSKMENELSLSLATGETSAQAIDRLRSVADLEWYQAERIVRTETAWAFNATHADGVAEIAEEVEDLYLRWVEYVSDDGEPLDNRVGADSIAMHGQIVRPGRLFTMPEDPDVDDDMWGKRWAFPPNRPNDRALVSAWRPHWGGLAWEYKAGGKVYR